MDKLDGKSCSIVGVIGLSVTAVGSGRMLTARVPGDLNSALSSCCCFDFLDLFERVPGKMVCLCC